MKKILLILFTFVSVVYAGWFRTIPNEFVKVDGFDIHVVQLIDDGNDSYKFVDSYKKFSSEDNFQSQRKQRIIAVFQEIEQYGKAKGYKSFIIIHDKVIGTNYGFPFDSVEDLADYCTLETKGNSAYMSYCNSSMMINGGSQLNIGHL
jgi:hypothetical protein